MFYYKNNKPTKLDEIKHNSTSINIFKKIKDNMNHQLIYGLNGCGKYTIIKTYINHMFNYDNKVYNLKNHTIELIFNGNKIDFTVLASPYHFEINCEDFNDKRLVNQFIKSVANTNNISNNKNKIIIVRHIELLTIEYQWMLRRTVEKLYKTCKIIFISNHISRIDSSISSRCVCLRIESPSDIEIKNILYDIIDSYKLNVNEKQLEYIIKVSQRNLKTAILLLEYSTSNKNFIKPTLHHLIPVHNIISKINQCNTPNNIREIRENLHDIILYDINLDLLQIHLLDNFIINKDISSFKKNKIISVIKDINNKIIFGYKKLYHLESLITKIAIINNYDNDVINNI